MNEQTSTEQRLIEITNMKMVGGKRFIPPRGNPHARLMIVSLNPSMEEVKEHRLHVGPAGEALSKGLSGAGIPEDMCWITSICKFGQGSKKISAKDIKAQEQYFQEELELLKPELIIALGGEAFKHVFGSTKFDDWKGMLLEGKHCTTLATYAPFTVGVTDPMLRMEFETHLTVAARHMMGHQYDDWTYEVVTDPARNIEIIQGYLDQGLRRVSLDAEWLPKIWNENEALSDLTYAFEPNHSIVLNLSEDFETENKALLDTMKLVYEREDIEILGWNACVDLKRLCHRGFNIPDQALKFDGMLAMGVIHSALGKGLDVGVHHFSNLPHYWVPLYVELRKNDLEREEMVKMKHINPDIWYKYVSGDGVSHFQVNQNMMVVMDAICDKRAVEYYYNTYLKLSWYLQDMETNGLPVDTAVMEDMTLQYTTLYGFLRKKMEGYTTELGIETYNPHYWSYTNSLFFDTFKLPVPYYKKKNKGKSRFWYEQQTGKAANGYKPSTNAKGMGIMYWDLKHKLDASPDDEELKFQFEVVKTQVYLNKLNPMANKFLSKRGMDADVVEDDVDDGLDLEVVGEEDVAPNGKKLKMSYWAVLGKNDTIYPSYFGALDNFRTSSQPNVQTAPAKTLPSINLIFKEYEKEMREMLPQFDNPVPRHIRHVFWPRRKDYYLVEVDVAGADIFHVAQLSNDKKLQRVMQDGTFHLNMARNYWNDPELDKEKSPDKVIIGKAMTFNSTYSSHFQSAAFAIQGQIYGETGQFFEVDQLEQMLINGWGQFPDYTRFKQQCEDEVKSKWQLTNSYGMVRKFEPTEDFGSIARYVNQGLAWMPASVMALHTHSILTGMRDHFKRQNEWNRWVYPVLYVHDAAYLAVHKDTLNDNYIQRVMLHHFCETPTPSGQGPGMEICVADRWKGKGVAYEAKTKYNFNTKHWYLPGI